MPDGNNGSDAPLALLIDDLEDIRRVVRERLLANGINVIEARSGEAGLEALATHPVDVVVLDVGLPGIDGFEVCRRIRAASHVPVLFLTARDGEIDRVLGLELGADDYVTKPFSPREIVARVRAILRRSEVTAAAVAGARAESPLLEAGDGIVVDTARREVRVRDEPVALATREFDLLAFLARNQGLALTRQQLLDGVWGDDWVGDDRTVDVHVRQLRKKVGDDLPLATVWGVGYRLG